MGDVEIVLGRAPTVAGWPHGGLPELITAIQQINKLIN